MEPRGASRARVWQREWESTPWDHSRRTVLTETSDHAFVSQSLQYENKRKAKMQKYKDYQVFYYGTEGEKSVRKSQLRHELKGQLDELDNPHQVFASNVTESKRLTEEARQHELQEKEAETKRREHLYKFRDENKMIIEELAARRKADLQAEKEKERARMLDNPFNWSHSLW